jgi:hypothetical protein
MTVLRHATKWWNASELIFKRNKDTWERNHYLSMYLAIFKEGRARSRRSQENDLDPWADNSIAKWCFPACSMSSRRLYDNVGPSTLFCAWKPSKNHIIYIAKFSWSPVRIIIGDVFFCRGKLFARLVSLILTHPYFNLFFISTSMIDFSNYLRSWFVHLST